MGSRTKLPNFRMLPCPLNSTSPTIGPSQTARGFSSFKRARRPGEGWQNARTRRQERHRPAARAESGRVGQAGLRVPIRPPPLRQVHHHERHHPHLDHVHGRGRLLGGRHVEERRQDPLRLSDALQGEQGTAGGR